jgi:hypothetical protein
MIFVETSVLSAQSEESELFCNHTTQYIYCVLYIFHR